MEIREATEEDAPAVRAFLENLSRDSLSLRYHTGVPFVRPWMVDAVTVTDHVHHEALLALSEGKIVGIAEWGRVNDTDTTADIGVVVRDDCRRHGIARALLRRLARNARAHDIDAFSGTVLSTNRGTIALAANVSPDHTTTFDGQTLEVRVPLRASA